MGRYSFMRKGGARLVGAADGVAGLVGRAEAARLGQLGRRQAAQRLGEAVVRGALQRALQLPAALQHARNPEPLSGLLRALSGAVVMMTPEIVWCVADFLRDVVVRDNLIQSSHHPHVSLLILPSLLIENAAFKI